MDILLDNYGDLYLNESADIVVENSVAQKIMIRLRWFLSEWRWDKDVGLPYFEELMIKNPNISYFEGLIRAEIFNVTEVTKVESVKISVVPETRKAIIKFVAYTDTETIREEVKIYG